MILGNVNKESREPFMRRMSNIEISPSKIMSNRGTQ